MPSLFWHISLLPEAAEGPILLDRHRPHATEYISISASLEKISTVTSKNFLTF